MAAPKEIAPTGVTAERVSAVTSVATATPSRVDLGSASAPALRGPTAGTQPAGPSVGPRQIANTGGTVGTGTVSNLPGGSSVREGIASNRDVLGSSTGPRLANVNSRVGEGQSPSATAHTEAPTADRPSGPSARGLIVHVGNGTGRRLRSGNATAGPDQ